MILYETSNELYHYGVLGMKWGVRRTAAKDAKEYARAKMSYGEGAGTRRKLIKNTVRQRSKDSQYKKYFDEALSKQDMAKHATKAKKERRRKDVKNATAKTGRGAINILTGHPERLGASMAGAYAAYAMAHKTGIDRVIFKSASVKMSNIYGTVKTERGKRHIQRMLKRRPK